jgi:hypothetical protein
MIEYTNTIDNFRDLENVCWGQAIHILQEIYDNDLEEELMTHLEDVFADNTPTLTELNDYISYDWEYIYESIGLEESKEDEEDY